MGAREVDVIAARAADPVRAAVGDGARWGLSINVVDSRVEPTLEEASRLRRACGAQEWLPAPYDVVQMSHLPGCPDQPLFESYASWFAGIAAWMPGSPDKRGGDDNRRRAAIHFAFGFSRSGRLARRVLRPRFFSVY